MQATTARSRIWARFGAGMLLLAACIAPALGQEKDAAQPPEPKPETEPGRERPDPAKIKSTVEALEQERQEQALSELKKLRDRRNDIQVRAQYAQQWMLSHYEFDIYSAIREPTAQAARRNQFNEQWRQDKASGLLGAADPEKVKDLATGELRRRNVEFSPERMRYKILKEMEARQIQRDAFLTRLLNRDEATKGSIARGTALNFFLEKLGAPAFDHTFYREMVGRTQSLAAPQKPDKLLKQGSEGDFILDDSVTRHIRYTRGATGAKLTGRLNEGPLDLAWPAALRSDGFQSLRQQIEKSRDKAIAELKSGKPVSTATEDELLAAANDLTKKIQAQKGTAGGYDLWRWVLAERFAKVLLAGAYRLVEARTLNDVVVETFKAGTIEELLAFMHRNGLRFAESDANGESAYLAIGDMMIRYYADLEALRTAVAEELKSMGGGHEGALVELSLGDPSKGSTPPELSAKGADSVIKDLKEFDKVQEGTKPAGNSRPTDVKKNDAKKNDVKKASGTTKP